MTQPRKHKPAYKKNRWHLLFVGKNGSVVPIIHFKGIVVALGSLVFVLIVTIGVLLLLFYTANSEKRSFQEEIAMQRQLVQSIRDEKDRLMARLAVAESKIKQELSEKKTETKDAPPESAAKEETAAQSIPSLPDKSLLASVDPGKKIFESESKANSMNQKSETIEKKISVENLFICFKPEDALLNIEFKVINIGAKKQPVSGYAFIVLKNNEDEPDRWILLPRGRLVDGKPSQAKGQRFRIYNFRTIKLKAATKYPELIKQATVFVYKNSGELLFENNFPVSPVVDCL